METFSTFPSLGVQGRVDPEARIIYGVSVAQAGEAAGHGLRFDLISLGQVVALGNQAPQGVKCRFAHPGPLADGLGAYLGRLKNFRLVADKAVADLHLARSASMAPAGDLAGYVLSLAGEDPAAFGVSLVVDLSRAFPGGGGAQAGELPAARIHRIHAADLVDEPALNRSLFHFPIFPSSERRRFMDDSGSLEFSLSPSSIPPSFKPASSEVCSSAAELQARVEAIEEAIQKNTVQIGSTPPRSSPFSRISIGQTPQEAFQQAWDWVFGVGGAPLPPPELRRTDALYRLITGDVEYHGVFQGERAAFASASTTTLADMAANAMNKVILEVYNNLAAYRWYEQVVAVQPTDGSLQDMAWIQFGGIANLPVVAEGAAYTELSVSDTKESNPFQKYGGYVGITDKMIRNSEIAKIQAIPRALTVAAIRTRSAAIASIFTANGGVGPTLEQDARALFHVNHGNLATTAYSWTAWKAARLECARQTEAGSGKPLMLFPRFWLGPADLYDQALIDFGYGAGPGGAPGTANNDVNPYAVDRPGDPRPIPIAVPEFTDGNDWAYLVDPKLFPVICMAYADSPGGGVHPAPQTYVAASPTAGLMFTNDVLPIKIRDYFAYGVATYRGIGKRNVASS